MPGRLYDAPNQRFVDNPGRMIDVTNPVDWQLPLNVGRIGWWKVISNPGWRGGSTLRDLVRGGGHLPHDGAIAGTLGTNVTWNGVSPSGGEGCLLFDGTAGYVNCPISTINLLTSPYTLLMWAYFFPTVTVGDFAGISQFGSVVNGVRFLVGSNFTQAVTVTVAGGGGSGRTSSPVFSTGAWHRLGFSSVAGVPSIWLDGRLVSTGGVNNNVNCGTLYIGAGQNNAGTSPTSFSNIKIDSVTLYNRVPSAAEFLSDYDLSRKGYPGVLNRLTPATWFGPLGATAGVVGRIVQANQSVSAGAYY